MNSALSQFQDWYLSQCDGDWEHGYGVSITTLDNPGWSVSLNLEDTGLEDVPFAERRENISDNSNGNNLDLDWIVCTKEDAKFSGNGGPRQLERIIFIFLDWARETRLVEEQALVEEGLPAEAMP